ncbi:MAG: aminodeoxychorismate/anthranilate synthase component II [Bacteroidales bacterium]|nr:aminodeoxychorismate/anthranilate synthase component II [Bacteroidales bacterium]
MKTIIIDNYDSFTYNLYGYVTKLGFNCEVVRNDQFKIEDIAEYDKIILSPGPGIPSESGLLMDVIRHYAESKPILGVCLGHQAIGEVFGANLLNLNEVYHGVATNCKIIGDDYIFKGLNSEFEVGRYHSWIVERKNLPEDLEITAISNEGSIMALKHRKLDVHGIQFHPESVLTPNGEIIIRNFLIN